jgi:exonuclease SbcD
MDEICHIAEREHVDLVIVAGDLFDAFHPSVEAIELLYKTLKKVGRGRK